MNLIQKVEEGILRYSSIEQDIDILADHICENTMTQDELANVLIGMSQMCKIKFQKLFTDFELLTKDYYRAINYGSNRIDRSETVEDEF
jgi:hypothetical protein